MNWENFPREKVCCCLCGSDRLKILSVQRSWPVSRCLDCGFIFLSERPAETALEEMYSREYYDNADVGYGGYQENFRKYNGIFIRLFDRRARDIEPYRKQGRLLEVGCAHGFLLDHLRGRGWSVTGVEVSPVASRYAVEELKLDVRNCRLEDAGFDDDSFDVVLLLDVLEHLHRPFETLSEIGRILSPGGTLVVQCPWELTHWEERAEAFLKGVKQCTITPDAVPAHLYFFEPSTLDAFLLKGGFRTFRRQSGNYGSVRRLIVPPVVATGSFPERIGRFFYYRAGLQLALFRIARLFGKGNGLIRYARFCK